MRRALCAAFGHKLPKGYGSKPPYAHPARSAIRDGTGCRHVHLEVDCGRCGKRYHAISMHLPREWLEWLTQ